MICGSLWGGNKGLPALYYARRQGRRAGGASRCDEHCLVHRLMPALACPAPPPSLPAWLQGVPQAPMCGFSNMACAILNLYGEQQQQQQQQHSACAAACWCWFGPPQAGVGGVAAAWLAGPLPKWHPRLIALLLLCLPVAAAGVEYGSRNVLADPEVRDGVKAFTAWPTIPQVRRLPVQCSLSHLFLPACRWCWELEIGAAPAAPQRAARVWPLICCTAKILPGWLSCLSLCLNTFHCLPTLPGAADFHQGRVCGGQRHPSRDAPEGGAQGRSGGGQAGGRVKRWV